MSYQGHKDYEHWNVALWLYNDAGLYNLVKRVCEFYDNKHDAALDLANYFEGGETQDGVEFTVERIEAAIAEEYEDD